MRKILFAFLAMLTLGSVLSGCFYYPYPYHYRYDRYDRDYRYDRGHHGEGGYDDRRDGNRDYR